MKNKSEEHIIFKSHISDIDEGRTVSFTDCTGLIPSDPKSREERSAYEEIYDYSADKAEQSEKKS